VNKIEYQGPILNAMGKKKAAPKGKAVKAADDDEDWDSILEAEIEKNATAAPPAPTKEAEAAKEEEDGAGVKKVRTHPHRIASHHSHHIKPITLSRPRPERPTTSQPLRKSSYCGRTTSTPSLTIRG
jgi:hypothetical protein